MMKNLLIPFYSLVLCLSACTAEYDPIAENIYIADAENVNSKRLTIDEEGGHTSFTVRMSAPASTSVKATLGSSQAVLDEYNKLNGTNYLPLPEHLYSFSEQEVTIEPGKLSASPVKININPLDESISEGDKYAIPVNISSVNGTSLLEASSYLVILLDKVIVTNILTDASFSTLVLPEDAEETMNMNNWTVEFLIRMDKFSTNQHVLTIQEEGGNNRLFARFGEFDHPIDEFQFKIQSIPYYGPTKYQPNVWHHIALTYDGTSYRLYKDGKLDLQVGAGSNAGTIYSWNSFSFSAKTFSEIRIWSCVRKEPEIASNMYSVNPDTEHLELYWKVNEGEGDVIHDYTKHQRHMTAHGTWVPGQRFPENME